MRGGSVGVLINAVGCTLRGCRVMHAATYGVQANTLLTLALTLILALALTLTLTLTLTSYGVQANALFTIDGCTIGECAGSGRGAGIVARAGCTQLRRNGLNENRVQKDSRDSEYLGYSPADCSGCLGRCTLALFLTRTRSRTRTRTQPEPEPEPEPEP